MKNRQISNATQKPFGAFVLSGPHKRPLRSTPGTRANSSHASYPRLTISALADNPNPHRLREVISFVHTCEQAHTPNYGKSLGTPLPSTHQLLWIVFTRVNTFEASLNHGFVRTCKQIGDHSMPPNPIDEAGYARRLFTRANTLARDRDYEPVHSSEPIRSHKSCGTSFFTALRTIGILSSLFTQVEKTINSNLMSTSESMTKDAFAACETSFVSDSSVTLFTRVNTFYTMSARMFVHTCEQGVLLICRRPGQFGRRLIYVGVVFTRVNSFSINFCKDFVHTCEQSNGAAMS